MDNGATSNIDDILTEHDGLLHVLPLPSDFSVTPFLCTNWVFELGWTVLGFGRGGSGTRGLGPGLDNFNFGSYQVLSRIRIM